jgi:hypothetical protein
MGGPYAGFCVGPLSQLLHDHVWFRAEYLMWWGKGAGIPPLLITHPQDAGSPGDIVLGDPGTKIIVGEHALDNDLRSGGRLSFGTWLDQGDNLGIEANYLGLGKDNETIHYNSVGGNAIFARPFFQLSSDPNNLVAAQQSSNVLAFPGQSDGRFNLQATSDLEGAEVLFRRALARYPGYRIELLAGYRYLRLDDTLKIDTNMTALAGNQFIPDGDSIATHDEFDTRNEFNGAEIGIATEWHRCRWSLESTMKMAIGDNHSQVNISGYQIYTPNGAAPLAPVSGGLLALPSNMGTHDADRLAVVPELSLNLGYDLTPRLRATFGYTFLYWSTVARPGDQIDTNLDIAQFPNPANPAGTQPTATQRPAFQLHTTDYWAQGVNLGLDFRF